MEGNRARVEWKSTRMILQMFTGFSVSLWHLSGQDKANEKLDQIIYIPKVKIYLIALFFKFCKVLAIVRNIL